MNIQFYFCFNIAADVVTVLLIFVEIDYCNHTFSHARIEAHTHKHACMISAQEEWREPGPGAWLGGVEEGFCYRQRPRTHTHTLAHTHTHTQMTAHRGLKSKKIRANMTSSKATRLLLME